MAPSGKSRKSLGVPVDAAPRTWVQTDRAAHEAWSLLALRKPRAAALLHRLVAIMGPQNAVVVSQKTLAKMLGCTERTIRNALVDLLRERWVQVVQIGTAGTVNAYVVNAAVAWGEKRDNLHLAVFSAQIVADAEDQPPETLGRKGLRRIPVLYPGEQQLPAGDGEPPPFEPALPGFEADLPGIGASGRQTGLPKKQL